MRTKTLALSALIGMLGSASVMAQNVYSLNAVGYVNVVIPANSFSIVADPLIASSDNTLNTIMNNGAGNSNGAGWLNNCTVQLVTAGEVPGYTFSDVAVPIGGKSGTSNTNGWANNGVLALNPGTAAWFENNNPSTAITLTFAGQVPQTSTGVVSPNLPNGLTNSIVSGYNLISSIVPTYGDLCSNTITALTNYAVGDDLDMYDPSAHFAHSGIGGEYATTSNSGKSPGTGFHNNWAPGDPTTFAPTQGFYYFNSKGNASDNVPYVWVENFTVNP